MTASAAPRTVTRILTPPFRVSYPYLFTPRKNADTGEETFEVQAVFAKGDDLTALRKAVLAVAKERWPKLMATVKPDLSGWPTGLRNPLRPNEEKWKEDANGNPVEIAPYTAGGFFATLKSWQAPGVVDEKVQLIIEPRSFYAGCYARAKIAVKTYPRPDAKGGSLGNKGVRFELWNIQKIKDGAPLGGGSRPEDDFEAVSEAASGDVFDE